ncbi:MAG: TetR/AcrR family transcriptional regulator [Nocardiopsaceae bacterium]|nr:TetR/AcrR family transcriptional regulator [Nocardiopsaceae bacterium]
MSPRTPAAFQRIKDERRVAIMTAALRVFARNGLAATRIADLAAEAHVSQGLLYHYFPNKEALFTAIVEGALRETAALTAGVLQMPGSAWERLEVLCRRMLEGVLENPDYPLVTLQVFTSEVVPEEVQAAVRSYGEQTFRDLIMLIQKGQQEGRVVDGNAAELATAFTAAIQGAALMRLLGGRSNPIPLRAETFLRMLRA